MKDIFVTLAARVIKLLKEAQDAECVPDRIIAISKLGAACTDWLGDMAPGRNSEYGQLVSQVVASAKNQAVKNQAVKSRPVGKGLLF